MRDGRRVVFLSLDDGSGPVSNVVFFHDAQEAAGPHIFRTNYMLVRGTTRRSGARGVSVTGELIWDLFEVQKTVRARHAAAENAARDLAAVEERAASNVIQMFERRA
jgi:error-prone DNA polymerase